VGTEITFVISMGGIGKRFKEAGYDLPKYMVKVKGKTLFEHSLSSLPLELSKTVVFIGLKEHEAMYNLKDFIRIKLESLSPDREIDYEVILLNRPTQGQAETALMAEELIDLRKDLAIYNIDTFFYSKSLKEVLTDSSKKHDGILGAFILDEPENKWSFAEIDQEGLVLRTVEKEAISKYALTGFYHFSQADDFITVAREWIKLDKRVKGEFYIAPMYNDLIKLGKNFIIDIAQEFVALGTPEDVRRFENGQ